MSAPFIANFMLVVQQDLLRDFEVVTAERVELRMLRGAREFVTHASGFTIGVIGTEYTVELGRTGVQVEVTRGEVEVRRDRSEDVWRVHAHERWGSNTLASSPPRAHP